MSQALPAGLVRSGVVVLGLLGCVALVVVSVTLLVQALASGDLSEWGWLGVACTVAIVVPAVRPALERVADRAAYGRRGDPQAALADFVRRISGTLAIDDVLPQLARETAEVTHSQRAEVRLWLADGGEQIETWPANATETPGRLSLPLEHGGERIGRLEVAAVDDSARDVDRQLLGRLAGPAGVALSNVRLTLELRRQLAQAVMLAVRIEDSRQRMLDTQRDQRARFVAAVRQRVLPRIETAAAGLTATALHREALGLVEQEIRGCLDALRELAGGVFPPVLAERGVAAALEWRAESLGVPVAVRSHDDARHELVVEAAVYFCCAALLDDTPRDGQLQVELASGVDRLAFVVRSTAPPPPATRQLMGDRVEALGGRLEHIDNEDADLASVVRGEIPFGGASVTALIDRLDNDDRNAAAARARLRDPWERR